MRLSLSSCMCIHGLLWCNTQGKMMTHPITCFDTDNDGNLFCVQCGSQGLSRQLFMRTFSTTTSEVGRTMKSFPYLLRLCNCSAHTWHVLRAVKHVTHTNVAMSRSALASQTHVWSLVNAMLHLLVKLQQPRAALCGAQYPDGMWFKTHCNSDSVDSESDIMASLIARHAIGYTHQAS